MVSVAIFLASLSSAASEPETRTFKVDGVERTALVYAPSVKTAHPPLVFGFHGHGGTARFSSRHFLIHQLWPEAVVVYPQGLRTKTEADRRGFLPGWQKSVGMENDRDLHFFDSMYTSFAKEFGVDTRRTYAMGHSNGAYFTYVLWAARRDKLAAVSIVAGTLEKVAESLKPLPALVIAGEKDTMVPFEGQQRSIEFLKRVNGISGKETKIGQMSLYHGAADLGVMIYPGSHEYPTMASQAIVEFFKRENRRD
ncbi:MAG: hypothetical protein BGO01_03065 [Armatimonadetes bacterium 55-13]|nr:esterase [Armatimonadota bacterium]OJU63640.1 MAG: hypothetical protein BGO01_03065 [Armatimonadetes bacterium 55-13]